MKKTDIVLSDLVDFAHKFPYLSKPSLFYINDDKSIGTFRVLMSKNMINKSCNLFSLAIRLSENFDSLNYSDLKWYKVVMIKSPTKYVNFSESIKNSIDKLFLSVVVASDKTISEDNPYCACFLTEYEEPEKKLGVYTLFQLKNITVVGYVE